MKKFNDLGTVTKRHVSGMAETDKGNRFPAGTDVSRGDQLVESEGIKIFISKDEWVELKKQAAAVEAAAKPKFQTGVTKALRDEAATYEIEVYETTTKDELVTAIEEAKAAKAGDE